MKQLLSIRGYARRRKFHHSTVEQAVREKKITGVRKGNRILIDPTAADEEWEQNSERISTHSSRDKSFEFEGETIPPYRVSRAIKKAYEARILKLKYEKELGSLVNAKEIYSEVFSHGRRLRNAILDVPVRVAGILHSKKNIHEVEMALQTELTNVLQTFVDFEKSRDGSQPVSSNQNKKVDD